MQNTAELLCFIYINFLFVCTEEAKFIVTMQFSNKMKPDKLGSNYALMS